MKERLTKHLEPQLAVLRDVSERLSAMNRSLDEQREKRDGLVKKIEERKKKITELTEAGADVREITAQQDHLSDELRMVEIVTDSMALQFGGRLNQLKTEHAAAHDALEAPLLAFLREEKESLETSIRNHLELAYRLAKDFDDQITEVQGELEIGMKRQTRQQLVNFPSCYGLLKRMENHVHAGPDYPSLMAAKASNHGRL